MEEVVKKLDEVLAKSNENKSALEAQINEQVKSINEKVAAQGGSLEDIQNEIKEIKAKNGALRAGEQKAKSAKEAIAEVLVKHYDELKSAIENGSKFSQ